MLRTINTKTAVAILGAPLAALIALGCGKSEFYRWDGTDAGGSDTDSTAGPDWVSLYEAVDFLLVVDSSESMDEEQKIFGTAQFTLINGLVNPLPTSGLISGLDDVRVAVISTDMGLSWGGHPYEDGDGWPGSEIPCSASGDNGVFQGYEPDKQISIEDGMIACDESGAQCPTGWSCAGIGGDGVGICSAPDGDTTVDCPWLSGDWAQTPAPTQVPNPYVATQVACLTSLGTEGCGFEQHLESSEKALNRFDQLGFVRDEALLAVIVVSDEDDCSIETNSFFYAPEIQEMPQIEINIACGEHPEHLYQIDGYRQAFLDVKDGDPSAVLFAVVVGVPIASACQGWGDEIQGCLDHPGMQLDYEIVNVPVPGAVYYAPACTRTVGDVEVTRAAPARRLVQLALDFGSRGFVSSICNDDWSQAMNELAAVIPLKPD